MKEKVKSRMCRKVLTFKFKMSWYLVIAILNMSILGIFQLCTYTVSAYSCLDIANLPSVQESIDFLEVESEVQSYVMTAISGTTVTNTNTTTQMVTTTEKITTVTTTQTETTTMPTTTQTTSTTVTTHTTTTTTVYVEPVELDVMVPEDFVSQVEGKTPALKNMTATAYCPCARCCGVCTGITASGATATQWCTVGASTIYPFGTIIYIPSFADMPNQGWFIVQDRGGKISANRIDIFFNTHSEALNFGRQNLECYIYLP